MDNRIVNISAALTLLLLSILVIIASPVCADIYRYEDDEGIIHFTDAPTDRRFKVFMRDLKKDKHNYALNCSFPVL